MYFVGTQSVSPSEINYQRSPRASNTARSASRAIRSISLGGEGPECWHVGRSCCHKKIPIQSDRIVVLIQNEDLLACSHSCRLGERRMGVAGRASRRQGPALPEGTFGVPDDANSALPAAAPGRIVLHASGGERRRRCHRANRLHPISPRELPGRVPVLRHIYQGVPGRLQLMRDVGRVDGEPARVRLGVRVLLSVTTRHERKESAETPQVIGDKALGPQAVVVRSRH
jgi:hypothetical protein